MRLIAEVSDVLYRSQNKIAKINQEIKKDILLLNNIVVRLGSVTKDSLTDYDKACFKALLDNKKITTKEYGGTLQVDDLNILERLLIKKSVKKQELWNSSTKTSIEYNKTHLQLVKDRDLILNEIIKTLKSFQITDKA